MYLKTIEADIFHKIWTYNYNNILFYIACYNNIIHNSKMVKDLFLFLDVQMHKPHNIIFFIIQYLL